jgi:hypothetical protein
MNDDKTCEKLARLFFLVFKIKEEGEEEKNLFSLSFLPLVSVTLCLFTKPKIPLL